jgi:hypothetical protein
MSRKCGETWGTPRLFFRSDTHLDICASRDLYTRKGKIFLLLLNPDYVNRAGGLIDGSTDLDVLASQCSQLFIGILDAIAGVISGGQEQVSSLGHNRSS